jgi:hypothetical protein
MISTIQGTLLFGTEAGRPRQIKGVHESQS